MTSLPVAHIAGMPLEETLASLTPALLLTFGAGSAMLHARLARSPARRRPVEHVPVGALRRRYAAAPAPARRAPRDGSDKAIAYRRDRVKRPRRRAASRGCGGGLGRR